jgi:guanylate kinase
MAPPTGRRGLLFVLSSPSGAGKSTLSRRLLAADPAFRLSVSATTRAPRPGEVEGEHYFFVGPDEFARMAAAGELLEHADVFGHRYGTPRAPVERWIGEGRDVLFDVDWQGASQLRDSALGADLVTVFLLPPSLAELKARLERRGQDAPEVIARRMEKSRAEYSHWREYDFVLVNEDVDDCQRRIETILAAERMRRFRQTRLADLVAGLDREFEEICR